MNSNKQLRIAYGLALILLIVGVTGYVAFSAKAPAEPIRLMYETSRGKVLFDHKTHASASGFGVACYDCHHHPEGDESAMEDCGACHVAEGEEAKSLQNCSQCHEAEEIKDVEMVNRADAFHSQCIGCHKDYEAGPVECSECHIM